MRHYLGILALLPLSALASACVISSGHNNPNNNNHDGSPQPVTVVVDTGQTMTATGGDGVGVFVQYTAGGHWHVWWACDTNKSGLACDFLVQIDGTGITKATSSAFEANDTLDTSSPNALVATTHTTFGVDAIDFDATPGQTITIDSSVSGLRDGNFFFWVADDGSGKPTINGGFTGQLTDPLIFQPSTP